MFPSGPKRLFGPRNMFSDNATCLEWILDRFWKSDFLTPKSIFGLRQPYSAKNVFWASFQNLTCPSVLDFNANKARGLKNMTISKDLSSRFLIEGLLFEKIDFLWIFSLRPFKNRPNLFKKCLKKWEKKSKNIFSKITSNMF